MKESREEIWERINHAESFRDQCDAINQLFQRRDINETESEESEVNHDTA